MSRSSRSTIEIKVRIEVEVIAGPDDDPAAIRAELAALTAADIAPEQQVMQVFAEACDRALSRHPGANGRGVAMINYAADGTRQLLSASRPLLKAINIARSIAG